MKKIITQEEIQIIMNILFQVNAPVQAYSGANKLFEKLPVLEEKDEQKTSE